MWKLRLIVSVLLKKTKLYIRIDEFLRHIKCIQALFFALDACKGEQFSFANFPGFFTLWEHFDYICTIKLSITLTLPLSSHIDSTLPLCREVEGG